MISMLKNADPQSERTFSGPHAIGWQVSIHSHAWSPPTDVYETDANVVVRVEIAGLKASDFTIDTEDNFLLISGVRSEASERRAYRQMEIRFGEFNTAVELPLDVDLARAEADYKDGFLTVIIPKLKPVNVVIHGG
jgi:HSP20 family protein